MKEVNRDINL